MSRFCPFLKIKISPSWITLFNVKFLWCESININADFDLTSEEKKWSRVQWFCTLNFFSQNTMGFYIKGNTLGQSGLTCTCVIRIWARFYSDMKPLIVVVSQCEQFLEWDPSYWILIRFGIPYQSRLQFPVSVKKYFIVNSKVQNTI